MRLKQTKIKQRLKLSRTSAEWAIIERKIKESKKKDLNTFLCAEISKLIKNGNKLLEIPEVEEDEKKICKVHYLSDHSYEVLKRISVKMKRPVSSIVDQLIINPLLCSSSD